MTRSLLIFCTLLILESFSWAGEIRLDSLKGAETVTRIREGRRGEIRQGAEVQAGDVLQTGEGVTAILIYSDQSKVQMSAKTEFKVESQVEETQWNRLNYGSVRGMIEKATSPTAKPKFLIRTRSATLGVRGTEFVFAQSLDGPAQIHTLEGVVDVGRDELTVLSGKGVPVETGHFVEALPGRVSSPQSFDVKEFMEKFNSESAGHAGSIGSGAAQASVGLPMGLPKVNTVPSEQPPVPTHFSNWVSPKSLEKPNPEGSSVPGEQPSPQSLRVARKDSDEKRGVQMFNFQMGAFFTQLPDATPVRAVHAVWSPLVPIPILSFLSLRGNLGGAFALNGSLASRFWMFDAQVLAHLALAKIVFVEAGWGWQSWNSLVVYNSQILAAQAGLFLYLGPIERVFVSVNRLVGAPALNEYKLGVGLGL